MCCLSCGDCKIILEIAEIQPKIAKGGKWDMKMFEFKQLTMYACRRTMHKSATRLIKTI